MPKLRLLWVLVLTLGLTGLRAQSLEWLAPDTVGLGQAFQLSVRIANADIYAWELPPIEGLRLLQGPQTSNRISIINGHTEREMVYTYWFEAQQGEGAYMLPVLSVETKTGKVLQASTKVLFVAENWQAPPSARLFGQAPRAPRSPFDAPRQGGFPNPFQDGFEPFSFSFEFPQMDIQQWQQDVERWFQQQLPPQWQSPQGPPREKAQPEQKSSGKIYKL